MSLDQLIDGINRGGFTFIGILFVSGCIGGLIWLARVGFPQTMARVDRILDQIDHRFTAAQSDADTKHAEIMAKLNSLGRDV